MTTGEPVHLPFGPLVRATFIERPVQFVVLAKLESGEIVRAHLADRGRLIGLLVPGRRLHLVERPEPGRRTRFQTVAAVGDGGQLVSLDTHLPNRLIYLALQQHAIPALAGYDTLRREVTLGDSRFDFRLTGGGDGRPCVVEVKSVGDLNDGVGSFPDAPTTRGVRHLLGLMALARSGSRAVVLFVVQGEPAVRVVPNVAVDPRFADTLALAQAAGVELRAVSSALTEAGITLGNAVPVVLP